MFLILHVPQNEPVFRGERRIQRLLVRADEIIMVSEEPEGSHVRLADGTELFVLDSFDAIVRALGGDHEAFN